MIRLLNKILEEENINHTKFAKDLDIARSYAVAMLNGTKPITENIYNKLVKLDYIAAKYSEELADAWFRKQYGDNNLKLVKHFIEQAGNFTFDAVTDITIDDISLPEKDRILSLDKNGIISAACKLLRIALDAQTEFYTNYSFKSTKLDDALYSIYKKSYNVELPLMQHFVALSDKVDKNALDSYWKILKWGSLRISTLAANNAKEMTVMPYFAVSGDLVVIFSEDEKTGYTFCSTEIAEFYKAEFRRLSVKAKQPLTVIKDESQLLVSRDYVSIKYLKTINTMILPMVVCDYDMLMRTAENHPEQLKEILIRSFISYYGYTEQLNNIYCYYTHDTFEDWAEKGLLYTVSEKYLHEFSVEDRMTALKNIIDKGMYSLLKKDTADFCRGYALNVTDKKVLTHFMLTYPGHTDYELLLSLDKSKYPGLADFTTALFAYFDSNNKCNTQEESNFLISQLIELHSHH